MNVQTPPGGTATSTKLVNKLININNFNFHPTVDFRGVNREG